MNYNALKAELQKAAYSGLDDQAAANLISVLTETKNRESISSSEIYNALDLTEFALLSAGDKARVDRILSLGGSVLVQGNVKTELSSIFESGTNTRSALLVAIKETKFVFGKVSAQIINNARTGSW